MKTHCQTTPPRWRSLLFVPANAPAHLMNQVHERGADAIVLDLEDSVAPSAKQGARDRLPARIADLAGRGLDVLVRINSEFDMAAGDLDAAVSAHTTAIVVPKVEDAAGLRRVADLVGALEASRDLHEQGVRLGIIALVESPAALARLAEIAAVDRVVGLALGGEDFSLCLGVPPTAACLTLPCQMIAIAAAVRGIMAMGLPTSIAAFDDLDAFAASARLARAMGLTGALCIHPSQVPLVNAAFSASDAEHAYAERVVAAWDAATSRGESVIALDGKLVDLPVVLRAQMLLAGVRRK